MRGSTQQTRLWCDALFGKALSRLTGQPSFSATSIAKLSRSVAFIDWGFALVSAFSTPCWNFLGVFITSPLDDALPRVMWQYVQYVRIAERPTVARDVPSSTRGTGDVR